MYKRFVDLSEDITHCLRCDAVLDGEIVCLDSDGRSNFKSLMYRRGTPYFYAFDVLELNGRDLRILPLITRKQKLKQIVPPQPCPVLFMDYVEEKGEALFELACRADLEGIVAKQRDGAYDVTHTTTWVKVRNPAYTQIIGRDKMFERKMQ